MIVSDLKFYPNDEGKEFWRFAVSFICLGEEILIKGLRYYPTSGHILPPMMPKPFRGQIVEFGQKVRKRLSEKMKAEIKDREESVFVVEGKNLKNTANRAWSDEELENSVIKVFCSGDRDVLERFMNLTLEKARSIDAEVPTQADKEFVLKRLKEVVDGTD